MTIVYILFIIKVYEKREKDVGTMTMWGILFSTIVAIVAIWYMWFGLFGEKVFGNWSRKAIDNHVTKEQAEILKAQLSSIEKSSFLPGILLPLSGLTIYGLAVWSDSGLLFHHVIVASTVFHSIMFLLIVGCTIWMLSQLIESRRFALPMLGEYMTDKEAYFIFWLAEKEDDYDSEFRNKTAIFPEHLVPILRNWESVTTFASAYERLRKSLKGKEEYLTVSQRAKQEELLAELREKTKEFIPFYQLLLNAVDKEALDEKKMAHINEIKEDIPVSLKQMALEISRLDKGALVAEQTLEQTTDGTVLQELKKVVDSTKTTDSQRKEASELVAYIQSMKQKEEEERERESVQMDALAVIQASRLLYGIGEEEVGRT